ncbi:MAG TPA: hypothetical protein VFI23_11005 [Rhizomicrobium sp.]|nr:hypothetical protein [Rhizomicrobium sp.]
MRFGLAFLAMLFAACLAGNARALDLTDDLTVNGYLDLRAVVAPEPQSWLTGGLGKFRYGGKQKFGTEGVLQTDLNLRPIGLDGVHFVSVVRAEPETRSVVDALESYLRYDQLGGDIGWSVKAGVFFPTVSLENDDLGWTSPYTLTPSAINSWIGDELRTFGSEATMRWKSDFGVVSLMGALICCNDVAGVLIADRGWTMNDRPFGLFERERLPDQTLRIFHAPVPGRTGMFDEIDGNVGWYAGAAWQLPGVVKLTVTRYDNEGDSAMGAGRDMAWRTKYWNFGARTQFGPLVLIAQQMSGYTEVEVRGIDADTKFQSGFLLASYDLDEWRFSAREDLFQTRRLNAINNNWNEDGDATTAAVSWTGLDGVRLTAEVIAMHSRRGEYVPAGLGYDRHDVQVQFDSRFFF